MAWGAVGEVARFHLQPRLPMPRLKVSITLSLPFEGRPEAFTVKVWRPHPLPRSHRIVSDPHRRVPSRGPTQGATPAHRHALIALLAREMKRGRPVVVRGVHHRAFGNQEVNEGCLPCGTEGLHHREGRSRGSPNPLCEAPVFYPLVLWQETYRKSLPA